jgi:hypothetical protein
MPCTAPVVILAESLLDRDVEKSTLHTFHNIRPATSAVGAQSRLYFATPSDSALQPWFVTGDA